MDDIELFQGQRGQDYRAYVWRRMLENAGTNATLPAPTLDTIGRAKRERTGKPQIDTHPYKSALFNARVHR